jgi:hypothetical protein
MFYSRLKVKFIPANTSENMPTLKIVFLSVVLGLDFSFLELIKFSDCKTQRLLSLRDILKYKDVLDLNTYTF